MNIMKTMKSLHIPLSAIWYQKLRQISDNLQTSATELARSAIIELIKEQEKKAISEAISQFASEYGGSEFDLDKDLEEASLAVLSKE